MSSIFSNGKILIGKANVNGSIIETLCVKVERKARKKKEIVLYPLLDANNDYILESIDVAGRAGLKKEDIQSEIKKYISNKDNNDYKEEMKSKVTEEEKFNSNDLFETIILAATTLDDLVVIYSKLEKNNLINRYKNKILFRLKKINIDDPFFFVNFNKHQDYWGDESSIYCFSLYMYKLNLLLQKYHDIKYEDIINFNGLQVKKGHYLEELFCHFVEQWMSYDSLYALDQEDYEKFCNVYSKFEYARYSSYPMAILYLSLVNKLEGNNTIVSKSVKEIILMYDKKVKNKMDEIDIPSLSFEQSYKEALETNNSIYYAKAFLEAKNNKEIQKLTIIEEKIKNSFFNIEECLLLQVSFLEEYENVRNWEINIIALVTLLDNANLKNSPNFKRLHLLFYQYLSYYIDWCETKTPRVLLKIKELYDNNYYKYDEEIIKEYKFVMM